MSSEEVTPLDFDSEDLKVQDNIKKLIFLVAVYYIVRLWVKVLDRVLSTYIIKGPLKLNHLVVLAVILTIGGVYMLSN